MSKLFQFCVGALALTSALSAEPQPAPHQAQMIHQDSCSHLSRPEQEFAQRLSSLHQQIFCGHFTGDQRAEVLALMVNRSAKNVTPDEAVEQVIKDSREDVKQSAGQSQMKKPPPPRTSYRNQPTRRGCGRRTT